MRRALRVVGAVAIGVEWLVLASAVAAADPNLGDLCSLAPADAFMVQPYVGDPGGCQGLLPGAEVDGSFSIAGQYADVVGSLKSSRDRAFDQSPGNPAIFATGDEGYAGFYLGGNDYLVLFRRGAYIVYVYGDTLDAAALQGYAIEIDQNLQLAGAGVLPTAPPVATDAPQALGVGLACGAREDAGLRLLACTASPFGQASNAVLTYQWRLDGVTRPETGSTMQVDIVGENLPAGPHVIGVTVTDTANNLLANSSASVDTTTGAFTVSVNCSYSESQGAYELACSAGVANPPAGADLSYSWTVNGAPVGTTSETMTRSVGQGPLQVAVTARDAVSGRQSNTAGFFLTVNPAGTLTNLLTLGQTSDPQNVIDALAGSAAVALTVGAGVAIGGALAGAGGVVGGGSIAGGAPSGGGVGPTGGAAIPASGGPASGGAALPGPAPTGMPLNAQPMGSETPASSAPKDPFTELTEGQELVRELFTPTEGATRSAAPPISNVTSSAGASTPTTGSAPSAPATTGTTSAGPSADQVAEGASQFLAAEAGIVPPPTPENLGRWRNLSGFPNTPEGNAALQRRLNELRQLQQTGKNPDTDLFLRMLREQAVEFKPPSASPTPSTPNPDKAYEDASNLLERTDLEWQLDIDRTKLPNPPPQAPNTEPKK